MKTQTLQFLSLLLLPSAILAAPTGSIEARACTDVTVIFARGTTETGTVGTAVGPPLLNALKYALGSHSVSMQGVTYAADVPGFLQGGDPTGSQTMANMVTSALSSCPDTKLVMSGYSQGGQLVHKAAKLLPAATTAKVSSAVIFGDPDNGQAVQGVASSKTDIICHVGDNICQGGDMILGPHLTYYMDVGSAASFIKSAAGF